jgi:hypothetical protein
MISVMAVAVSSPMPPAGGLEDLAFPSTATMRTVAQPIRVQLAAPCETQESSGTIRCAINPGAGHAAPQSLNNDPFNVRAEELAMQECTTGIEVRRVWTELEMVRSFGGKMSPGTPDGMFESWDGDLTCVQVVRVPLVVDTDVIIMQDTLVHTVITKVVKSQSWLRFSCYSPCEFIIFCWLPFSVSSAVTDCAELLMKRVRLLDHRFSLRLRTPDEPSSLFPALFARHQNHNARARSFTESDISTYQNSDHNHEELEEDFLDWDITWGWNCESTEPLPVCSEAASNNSVDDDDFVCEWNLWADNG